MFFWHFTYSSARDMKCKVIPRMNEEGRLTKTRKYIHGHNFIYVDILYTYTKTLRSIYRSGTSRNQKLVLKM